MPVYRTADGIDLVYRSVGAGPHVLLLHGTSTDHTTWEPVQSALAEHFQLSILARRGRCGSGDSLPYVLQREFEDVATLADALGGPVDIVGHSFGALCALEGALRSTNVRRLVLYESPLPGAFPYWPDSVRDRMVPLLARGSQSRLSAPSWKRCLASPSKKLRRFNGSRIGPTESATPTRSLENFRH